MKTSVQQLVSRGMQRNRDTWRNLVSKFDTIKVVEYKRGEILVRQTTEIRAEVSKLFKKIKVPEPPRLHHLQATTA